LDADAEFNFFYPPKAGRRREASVNLSTQFSPAGVVEKNGGLFP
jgi:hypothetical protein